MKFKLMFLLVFIICLTNISIAANKRRPVPALPAKPTLEETYSENNFNRVDPHGLKNIKPSVEQAKQNNECSVCHFFQKAEFKTKPTALTSCFNCHNHSPHSGVDEHLKHKVSCTDCHSVHRGASIEFTQPSGLFKNLKENLNVSGLIEKTSQTAMLKKSCTECHKQ